LYIGVIIRRVIALLCFSLFFFHGVYVGVGEAVAEISSLIAGRCFKLPSDKQLAVKFD